jgi:TfoX/Sxy family transcriptional regulator of competence genes
MAWVKVPADNHPLFHAALPRDRRVSTVRLFGSIAGLVNGNMFCGLFARSALVKLGEADHAEAMKLDGSEPFDPMQTGRVMSNTVLLPETIMDEPGELRDWFHKAFAYAVTLPPKKKKAKRGAATTASAPRSKPAAKKSAATQPATKKSAKAKPLTKKRASKKPATRKPATKKRATRR